MGSHVASQSGHFGLVIHCVQQLVLCLPLSAGSDGNVPLSNASVFLSWMCGWKVMLSHFWEQLIYIQHELVLLFLMADSGLNEVYYSNLFLCILLIFRPLAKTTLSGCASSRSFPTCYEFLAGLCYHPFTSRSVPRFLIARDCSVWNSRVSPCPYRIVMSMPF